ncbi:hypothetical protein BC834DRAFT_805940, partial [Gloeopeniophorella convolvens]
VSLSLLGPFLALVPIFYYLFSPFLISFRLLIDVFIFVPYRVTLYVLEAVYPFYAFIVIACISGAVIGIGARQLVSVI